MTTEVRLPKLGETMQDGVIVAFMVKVGDEVKKGDYIFDVETDKATVEVESPAGGFVKDILVEVGQTVLVGDAVLVLGGKDEEIGRDYLKSIRPRNAAIEIDPPPTKIAMCSSPSAAIKLGRTIALTEKQKVTAQKMLQSKREIPCFYLTVRADVTELVELRNRLNKMAEVEITYNDFIMRAVADGLRKFPNMTGQLAGDAIFLADDICIGLAIDVPDGVVAPIIKDVDKKNVTEIAKERAALVEKARNNKLKPSDFEGGCITISNLGPCGVESFIPIVIPGQCSILGIGKIIDACIPDNSDFAVRKLMAMTLSVDHRITNGAYAGQFLDFVRKQLEDTSTFT
jgi:pyruvate dehydrogenase E2 component (dihydrolipoamide acetyltransferase)